MITQQAVLDSLKHIIDPDFNKDIVSLGFVKNIQIKGKDVSLDIELTTPACPVKNEFQKSAEESLKKIPGIGQISVTMTSIKSAPQGVAPQLQSALTQVKSIIAVSSCKGGVGKSTVAAFLSKGLAQRGFKVGLLDADIHGPSIPTLFNIQNPTIYTNEKDQIIPLEYDNLKVMSFGFVLGDAPAVLRGPIVSRYIQQLLHQTAWGELDYLFIDMPPGTGDIQLTITQSVRLNGAVIVTTPQTLSLVDVARGILMFEKVQVPILGIIENMSYFLCDGCQKKHFIFGKNENNSISERFGVETLAQLPLLESFAHKFDKPLDEPLIQAAVDKVVMAIGKQNIAQQEIPEIHFDDKNITLRWKDKQETKVSNLSARLSCRCAVCVDEISGKQLLQKEKIRPDIQPKEIFPLGNYALAINWNDGHSSGIYPYKTIRELAGRS